MKFTLEAFNKQVKNVVAKLGLGDKKAYTEEDTNNIVAEYNKEEGADFYADLKKAQDAEKQAKADKEALTNARTALNSLIANSEEDNNGSEANTNNDNNDNNSDNNGKTHGTENNQDIDVAAEIKKLGETNAGLKQQLDEANQNIQILSGKLEEDKPKNETMTITGFALTHTAKHAFGIESPVFSTDKRWNKIAVNPREALLGEPSKSDEKAFKQSFNSFGEGLAARYAHLKANNLLDPEKLMSTTLDFTEVGGQLGNYYVVRRQDALIAQILKIPTIYDFFPRRYGIQDMEVIFNVLFTEVSQAWQSGKVFKGSASIQPETGHVDDVSIKLQFEPLVDLERQYVGYLNTESSDPVKWGMIEWYTIGLLTKGVQEQNKRRVMGIYVKPETDKAGLAINGSTGIIYSLIRYAHQYKMQLVDGAAYRSYDNTTLYDTAKAYLNAIIAILGDQDLSEFTLVLNRNHKTWWLDNIRENFGQMTDFAGPKSNVFPDYDVPIYWMPGMGNYNFMFLTKAGNIQCLENKPGEMLALYFETDFEDVLVRSRWKEGVSAAFVGKKFTTLASLVANAYENQQIFMNKPVTLLADDSVTLNATLNFWFMSQANTTSGKKITTIANAKKGPAYIIECGDTTNPQSIDKSGEFANITAAWTPVAVGDYIMVTLDDAGTAYRELERCVNGVRTVNSAVQPTLPEARS